MLFFSSKSQKSPVFKNLKKMTYIWRARLFASSGSRSCKISLTVNRSIFLSTRETSGNWSLRLLRNSRRLAYTGPLDSYIYSSKSKRTLSKLFKKNYNTITINNKQKNNQLTIKQKISGHKKANKKTVCRPHNLYSLTVRVWSAHWPVSDRPSARRPHSKQETVCPRQRWRFFLCLY